MSFEPLEYLRHILAEAKYLEETSRGLSRQEFLDDQTLRRAFSRSLEIVGEATKKVPATTYLAPAVRSPAALA